MALPPGPQSGYDRVGVPDGNGTVKMMTRSQFEDLPLGDRVKLLMGGRLEFFRGDQKLTAREALRGA
jgi:hypothetical protein